MNLQILNPLTIPNWDELLLTAEGASFFHSSAWARVLSESYGYTHLYFAVLEGGRLQALIPVMEVNSLLTGKRGVSLPFTDYCEPIINETVPSRELLATIVAHGQERGWNSFELRGGQNLLSGAMTSTTYLRHTLDLMGSPERIFLTFRKGTKAAIKKAENGKIRIITSCSKESVLEFYELNCITRKYHGLPPQPRNFFMSVYQHILRNGLGIVILALYEGTTIAGGVFFHFGREAMYKYGASKREYQELRANNIIVWNAIKYYLEKGCRHFCFGRTEPENEGLRIFKTGWGTQEHSVHYHRYDVRLGQFVSSWERVPRFQEMVFRKMPIRLLKIIGTMAYRHIG